MGEKMTNKKLTPMKAIRQNCIDCSGGSKKEVRECMIVDCPLYMYRLGKNPRRKGIGNSNPNSIKKEIN